MAAPIRPAPKRIPIGQIRWLLGNIHVGTSDRTVIRDIRRRTAQWSRSDRRAAIRYALLQHKQNGREYSEVMGAMLGQLALRKGIR
jgi:hypothetical protein